MSTCVSGDMPFGPVRLPDELRKNLKLDPVGDVEGLEAREHGWVGYARLHFPKWAQGDAAAHPSFAGRAGRGQGSPSIPLRWRSPFPPGCCSSTTGRSSLLLTGRDPFVKNDACDDLSELRLAMYVVDGNGKAASRVLEWPAATCKLGRAEHFELSVDGNLTIGYTNGFTVHFVWSGDHFERSELG